MGRTARCRLTVAMAATLAISQLVPPMAALGCARPVARASPPTCKEWIARTTRAANKVGELKWHGVIVAALRDACTAIPAGLQAAAARATSINDREERARILAQAAQAVLGPACTVPDPLSDARRLAAACPLPRAEFKIDDEPLADMRAVDYALLNALQKSLVEANEYDALAEQLLRYFTLSASLLGEEQRKREAGKKARPRLLEFLDSYAATMPRVALRYAIEHLEPDVRTHYLGLRKARG